MTINKFIVPIDPVPASRPRVTRWSTFYSKKYTQFKKDMAIWVITQPKHLLSHHVVLSATFYIKIPTSMSKKKKIALEGQYCDKNIDIDNLLKALFDGINGHIIEDDRFIVKIKDTEKIWSSNPRIEFLVYENLSTP